MKIIVAPNAFKASLSADLAGNSIIQGLKRSPLRCDCIPFPVGDGGDGTAALLARCLSAKRVTAKVNGPLAIPVESQFYVTTGHTAIIELADASGLRLVPQSNLDPLTSTTFGTGELIRKALDLDARKIILAIGGSATVDGATGILRALGVRFLNSEGKELTNLPASLPELIDVDTSAMDKRILETEITILCDVQNPIIGPQGAATVFGPQKGASPAQVALLENGLRTLSDVIERQIGIRIHDLPRGGAAGGVSAVVHALCNAKLVNGIDYFLQVTDFDKVLHGADLVITGEGMFDDQTLFGKAPMGVARSAVKHGARVVVMAGDIALSDQAKVKAKKYFSEIYSLKKPGRSIQQAVAATAHDLEDMAFAIGRQLALS